MKNVTSYAQVSTKSVDQLIAAAITSLKTMRAKVQVASVAVLMHAEKTGDYRKANDLVVGLGNGINKASLQKFFVDFGGLVLDEEGNTFVGWSGKDTIKANFETAKSTEWWSLKDAPSYKGFDLSEAIAQLIKRATAEQKKADSLSEEDRAKLNVPESMLNNLRLVRGNMEPAVTASESDVTPEELLEKVA